MQQTAHTDVMVLGGGAAGVAAAIAVSRNGSSVSLVERNAFLGGKATAAEVGTVCGLYEFNKTETSNYLVKGFAKEFAESLQKASGTKPLYNTDGLHYLPYNIEAFKKICLDLLEEHQVKLYLNTTVVDTVVHNDNIESVSLTTSETGIELRSRSVIDCSGESIISRLCSLPVIESDHYQAAAQVFTMKGVIEENETRLGMILMKALRSAIDQKQLPDFYDRVYIVQGSLKNDTVSLKIGLPVPVTYTAGNLQQLKESAQQFIHNLSAYLIQHVAAFKNASIDHIAPEVGIRVGTRTMGNYVLTGEDVLSCKKFNDAIANSSWPIEEWGHDRRVKMRYLNPGDHYQIPAGCLRSKHINNLFMAGRNISATDAAIASARVMGICLQTGYAAGCLASALARGLTGSEALKSIQNGQL